MKQTMNRRRALISYEMKKMRWILLVAVLAAMLFVLMLYGRVHTGQVLLWTESQMGTFGSYFSYELLKLLHDCHIYVWLLFAVSITIQFLDFHNKKTEEYMSSLPFTGRERFLTKLMIGYVTVFISWFVMAAGTLVVRQKVIIQYQKQSLLFPFYKEMLANETLWHTLRTLGMFALELLAAYSLFVLVHSIVNKSGIASAITLGIMLAPYELYYVVYQFCAIVSGNGDVAMEDRIWRALAGIFLGDSLAVFNGRLSSWEAWEGDSPYYYISYSNIGGAVVLLLVIIVVCSVITWFLSKGRDMTRNGVLVSYKWARVILAVGIGVCFGGMCAFFFPFMGIIEVDREISYIVDLLLGSAVFGFIAWKLLKISIR